MPCLGSGEPAGGAGREENRINVEGYVEYLYGLGLSPSTVRMYKSALRRAWQWATETGVDLADPTATDIAELRGQYVESSATLRQVRCALQHYWDWVGAIAPPVKALRVPSKPRPYWRGLDDDVARKLAVISMGWHPEGTATLIGLYTGLRRSEIAAMRWDRFSPDFATYQVTGKGGVTATVPIHSRLRGILRPLRGGFVWVFPGTRRLHVNAATVWAWVGRVAEEAGVHVTPHQLRHTIVNRVAKASTDLRVAQRFARHARVDTTQLYVQAATDEEVMTVLEGIDWLGPTRSEGVA